MTDRRALRSWLRRSPAPARIRADGREIAIPNSASRWADLASTLEGIGATQVECLGADGQVLRALSLADPPEDADPEVQEVQAEERREKLESQRVREAVEMARVVSEAGERAARLHAETYAGVLQRYEALLGLIVQRLTSAERGYQTALIAAAQAQAQSILDRAEADAAATAATAPSADPLVQLVAAAAPALLGSQTPPVKKE